MTLPTTRHDVFTPPPELLKLDPMTRLVFANGAEGWLATSHAAVRTVLADSRFSARAELQHPLVNAPFAPMEPQPAPPGFFPEFDPPEHTRFRRLLTGQFTVRRLTALEPRILEITSQHLDAMAQAGPVVDLVEAFALPIPVMVICELLGIPFEQRAEFLNAAAVLPRPENTLEQFAKAQADITDFLARHVIRLRAKPGGDLLSGLVSDSDLTDEELVNVAAILLLAGHETTANMLAIGTYSLLSHPSQASALRRDPSLITGAVEELLRYHSIIHIGPTRAATEDVEIAGQLVKAGEVVALSLPAANHDPEWLDHPTRLDVTRSARGHVAFGHGVHQCLGQQLARTELRIGYRELLRRFPTLRLADGIVMRADTSAAYGVEKLPVTWTS